LAEKEHAENIMQGVSLTVLGNIGGLLASLVAFVVLVVGYTLVVDKKMMRSDFVFYFFIFNVVCLVGVIVVWAFLQDKQISID
jgi:ABC-type bacteriocin/lantibiotic exporter with double-glycine peptidase domain